MKVKHVMVTESKSLCGRQVAQGDGKDCGNCARISEINSAKAAAMVPSGNGLTEDTLPALTEADIIARDMDAADIAEYNAQRTAETAVIIPTPEIMEALRNSTRLIAYKTAARYNGKMQFTGRFRATVAEFNRDYGQQCRTWADVRAVMIAAGVQGVKP